MNAATATASTPRRPYRMRSRAVSAQATAERILRAVVELHVERFHEDITLDAVAQRAGVTVQTVLRRFGSKEALVDAAAELSVRQVEAQRAEAPVGDIPGAVDTLLDHYEEWGQVALRLLAQEDRVPQLARIAAVGRRSHHAWVDRTFAPLLDGRANAEIVRATLVALTDVYAWKVLHIDLGLARAETHAAIAGAIRAVVDQGGHSP